MKKNFFYAMMSAIALTSAIGFTACSSDSDAVVENNPTYDGTGVRADFAFSITKASQGTRMSDANVQETGPFRGIEEMYLLPFSAVPADDGETNAANFPLGALTTSDITSTVGDPSTAKSSKVYSLLLPLGTNNFLFYGKAPKDSKTNFQVGNVTSTLSASTTHPKASGSDVGISFGLTSIQTSLGGDAAKIAAYLTDIAKTEEWAGTVTTSATDGNYRALAKLYNKFISNASPRAGSSEAVVRTVLDLYRSAAAINGESSVAGVKTIAARICNVINTSKDGVKVTVHASDDDPNNWTAEMTGANAAFPSNLDLPMGAAQLQWDGAKFVYGEALSSLGTTGYTNAINQYRYPAEIIYFDNSPLRATDQYKTASNYPTSAANWDLALGSTNGFTSDWDKTVVSPSTRAVAMQNNVNYGVAMLETKVQLKGGNNFDDNRAAILASDGVTTNQNDIDGTKFKVTGLLIGGQPASVGWDMTNPGAAFEEIIYDKDVQYGNALSTSASSSNYTIVFDNYATPDASGHQKNVLIALEIQNGDKDFYGYDGLIPAGSTFYLVGTLNPTSGTTGTTNYTKATRPASYRITKEDVQRVFMQDYKTVATIGLSNSHALKKAYSTIPDLRSTEIVFGLSVDLKWETGVQFNITIN